MGKVMWTIIILVVIVVGFMVFSSEDDLPTGVDSDGSAGGGLPGGDAGSQVPGGDSGSGSQGDESSDAGVAADLSPNFELFVSDTPADIGDFDSLILEFSYARVFIKGGTGEDDTGDDNQTEPDQNDTIPDNNETDMNETDTNETDMNETNLTYVPLSSHNESTNDTNGNETDNNETDDDQNDTTSDDDSDSGGKGWSIIDLTGQSVDLTQLVDGNIEALITTYLAPGMYTKVELHVVSVTGIVNGTEVEVKVPSSKLMITRNFEITEGTITGFVFDINVVKKGNKDSYNLKPVISGSGVIGEDIPEEDVEEVEETA